MKYFGTDGIRNHHQQIFNMAYPLGVVLASRHKTVAVARDTRPSSFDIEKQIVRGLLEGGAEVHITGVLPTPALAYTMKSKDIPCGVMITASHNPPECNGLKVVGANGKLGEEEETELDCALDSWQSCLKNGNGKVELNSGASREYKRHVISMFQHLNLGVLDRQIYLDTAHGCFSYIAKDIFETLGADVVAVCNDHEGDKINVGCGATSIGNLVEQMTDRGIGFAFDGDGDRVIAVVDGKIYDGDQILYNIASYYKSKSRGNGNVVGTIMTGSGVEKALEKQKIKLHRADVGDKYVAKVMGETGAILGGEKSGHIIIGDKADTGDGVITALTFLEGYIGGFLKKAREYRTENYNLDAQNPRATYESEDFQVKMRKFVEKIGKRGRVIVRPSGTESVVRISVEVYDKRLDCTKLLQELEFCKNLQKSK